MARLVLEVWIASLRRIGPTWRSLLSVNLVYAALGILVLLPLTGVVGRFLIGLSGRPVLSDQDIASFFLTPVGAASLTLFAAILIAIQALAQASMMHIGRGAWLTGSPTLASLQFAAHRAVPILDFSVRLVARLIVITAPFLGASALAAWLLISGYDINYYLALRPSEFWLALLIVGALMLLMSILVARKLIGWSLALPLMLFAETAPGRAFAESERLTRPGRRLVLWVLILWTVVSLLLGAAVLWVFLRSANWIVPHFHDQPGLMILVLGGLVALWACLSFLLGIFNSATFAFSILGLGERLGCRPGSPMTWRCARRTDGLGRGWAGTPWPRSWSRPSSSLPGQAIGCSRASRLTIKSGSWRTAAPRARRRKTRWRRFARPSRTAPTGSRSMSRRPAMERSWWSMTVTS